MADMVKELESFFSVLDWLHVQGPYMVELVFTLTLSGFVLSMYVVMSVKKRKSKNVG
ncbi:MAG: hypothetical protein GKS07_09065 [Nitrosopumilus sp.]|nr:MAG: hypothetical protein GKS07_09065 [Nitrosopumilus sp.]